MWPLCGVLRRSLVAFCLAFDDFVSSGFNAFLKVVSGEQGLIDFELGLNEPWRGGKKEVTSVDDAQVPDPRLCERAKMK